MTENDKLLEARINELEKSIADSREQFLAENYSLKKELNEVRKLAQLNSEPSMAEAVPKSTSYTAPKHYGIAPDTISHSVAETPELTVNQTEIKSEKTIPEEKDLAAKDAWEDFDINEKILFRDAPEEKAEPGFLNLLLANILQSFLGFLLNSLNLFQAPFQELYQKLVKLYFHYQKQGKAPVFLMTVAGLITLTFGFGYLLQYSFNSVFNDTLKALTGFVIGIGIIAAGILLAIRKTDFREYAASVIALGVIFNYLTAYFIGPYYALVSETTGFLLLLAVTAMSFVLSLRFETRVVSVVTLVGGVFMPFIVGDVEAAGLVFLSYLLILSCANLYLSLKIKWSALAALSFILSLSVIEYVGISEAIYPVASISLLSAFFYLYLWFWTFDGFSLKEKLSKQDLTILVANIFYFLYAMMKISSSPMLLAGVLFGHAVILILLIRSLRLMQSVMAPLYLLMTGLLFATAVFLLLPADLTSIVWAIEGLAMLYIGFHYAHKLIRVEGYVIYVISMISLLWQAIDAFIFMGDSAIAWHWINLTGFGVLSFIAYRLINRFADEATSIEKKSSFIQNEIFTLWGAIALCLIIAIYTPTLMMVLAAIPVLWCFYRVSKYQLKFAQLVGFVLLMAFVVQIVFGLIDSNSILITRQPVISWIAMFELLLFGWILHFYYQYFEIDGRGQVFALNLHQTVFDVPVALTLLAIINIFQTSSLNQFALQFSFPWFDLIVVAGIIALLYGLVVKTETAYEDQPRTRHATLLIESAALLSTVFFLYTVFIIWDVWMFNAAVIPLLGLLYVSLKKQLPLTQTLAWTHFILFSVGIFISYQQLGHLHFSEQSWSTRLLMVEVLLSSWAMLWVYQRTEVRSTGYRLALYLRVAVYCVIPLLFLPRVLRLSPDYLATALWVSFTINWLMYKKLKIDVLQKQLIALFFIASVATVIISLMAISGSSELAGLLALLTGLLVISLFHVIEKTLSLQSIKTSVFYLIHLTSPYFYAFVIAGITYAATHQLTIAMILSGLYFLKITQQKKLRIILHESITLAYALTWLGLVAVPLTIFSFSIESHQSMDSMLIAVVCSLISVVGLWELTHRRIAVYQFLWKKYFGQNNQYLIFHLIVLIAYVGVLNTIFMPWTVAMSIAMLIHAVVILFLTLSEKYKNLLRLSIALYGLTAVKVLLHDMNDFGNLHKVFALMGIGCILMAAAFMFQKIRARQMSSLSDST